LRPTNVLGTREVVRLAYDKRRKILNYISTTFIFGWSVKKFLFESDFNEAMEKLDFGYSQSKWVAEQLVKNAQDQGLDVRIFRPSLITPSTVGGGYNYDIAIRLMAFMINHRKGVIAKNQLSFTPADIAANNIVAISILPDTVGKIFHVTADHYYNIMDVTEEISKLIGKKFEYYKIPEFVNYLEEHCTKKDLVFPLLNFFTKSAENISAMEFKRYKNSNYKDARSRSPFGKTDASLKDIVGSIVHFLRMEQAIQI